MLDALTERVLKEGRVIKDAPVAFGVCVGLSFLICLAIVNWHYSERLELQKSTIDSQKDRIEAQSNKLVEYQRELGRGIQPSVLTAQSLPPSVVKRLADYS